MGTGGSSHGQPCSQSEEPIPDAESGPVMKSSGSRTKCTNGLLDNWRKCHRHVFGGIAGQFLSNGEKALLLIHHNEDAIKFEKRILASKVRAWTDKRYRYRNVPSELVGAVLLAGPMQMRSSRLTLESPKARGFVYIWCEDGLRDGGIPMLGWDDVGTMYWKWGRGMYERSIPLRIYKKRFAAGSVLDLQLSHVWVGGIAFKQVIDHGSATWVPPPFMTVSGETVSWDHQGVDCIADVRERIGEALGFTSETISLVSAGQSILNDTDPLPSADSGFVSVVINQRSCDVCEASDAA